MDIAVVGLGCKFPQATGTDQYWHLLANGLYAISDCTDRPMFDGLSSYLQKGGYIDNSQFDLSQYNISPREARHMDPQQKIILEVTQQALTKSKISSADLSNSRTGVFIGVMGSDWGRLTLSDIKTIDLHTGTGNGYCMIPNRISYLYNLKGPSIAIDTACSSSLVALDSACKYLLFNEIDVALVGGVNSILTPALNVFYQKAGLASKDGKCKAFGSQADGIVRGEGGGIVILKRLENALKDNNKIHAVIKATAVNHDGKSNGLTAPNKWAQIEVINSALKKGNLKPSQIDYIEAHGTGTLLGDPIEIQALHEIIAKHKKHPLKIGSVKSNLGHLEGAAGIASLIKVILSLQKNQIPASLHYGTGNPYIDFRNLNVAVITENTEWNADSKFAGISSFGLGGTNAHVILTNYKYAEQTQDKCSMQYNIPLLNFDADDPLFATVIKIISEVTEQPIHLIRGASQLIHQLGIDSLMMAELKEMIELRLQLKNKIEFSDILQLSTVTDLYLYVKSISK